MVVLADGLDRHVAGVYVLLLRRHGELWLVARAAVLAGEGEQIIGCAADVMIRVGVVLTALLLLFSPSALQWLGAQEPASADNSGPDTR